LRQLAQYAESHLSQMSLNLHALRRVKMVDALNLVPKHKRNFVLAPHQVQQPLSDEHLSDGQRKRVYDAAIGTWRNGSLRKAQIG
jgi:hypothetical protein